MPIQRGSIIRGPAVVTFGGQTFRTKGDVQLNMGIDTFDVESSEFGPIDKRRNGITISLSFTPVGVVTAAIVPVLWPHLSKTLGTSLFGASDVPCTVAPVGGGVQLVLSAAAITKMPGIDICATKTSMGQVGITGILANNKEWSDAAARYAASTISAPTLAAIDTSTIPTSPARVTWEDVFADLPTAEGVHVEFDLQTNNEETDEDGLVDITMGTVSATASFEPVGGVDLGDLLDAIALQGSGVLRGTSLSGHDLTIAARDVGGLTVVIPDARLDNLPLNYGPSSRRIGSLSFQGFRTSGAAATITVNDDE